MTPSKAEIRSFTSLLLGVYSVAVHVTYLECPADEDCLDIRVDEACEEPVSEVSQHCQENLEELAKEPE